jgi:putative flippase GtrA
MQLPLNQLIRFGITGFANTAMHGLVLALAVEKLHWHPTLGHLLAFLVANQFSYQVNARWTFVAPLSVGNYVKFLSASLVALASTLSLAWIVDLLGYHYLVGFAMVVVVVPLVNFLAVKSWVFQAATDTSQRNSRRGD